MSHPITTVRRLLTAIGALVLLAPVGAVAAQADSDSPHERRREVQRREAALAAQLDVLRASDAEVDRALADLQADLDARRADATSARQAADVAIAQRDAARAAEAEVVGRIQTLRVQVRDMAIKAYIGGPTSDVQPLLDSSSLGEAARRRALLSFITANHEDLLDQLRAAEEDLGAQRAAAESAAATAEERLERAEQQLAEAGAARARQMQFADTVQTRLDRALSEAASLSALDRQLAAEITRRQESLARRLPPGGRSGGRRRVGAVQTTWVRGIEVNTEIADELGAMLGAAEGDGIRFGGGGYRDPNQQVEARRRNCGTSDYAIYDMPPSQCSPPTARPGTSMHEQGLAIDFTHNGSALRSSSPGFRWLGRNAARYGFQNLDGEPWHWSTNGN